MNLGVGAAFVTHYPNITLSSQAQFLVPSDRNPDSVTDKLRSKWTRFGLGTACQLHVVSQRWGFTV